MAELEVHGERIGLAGGEEAICFENHHCSWMTRKSVSNDEFGNDVQRNELVRDSLNDACRDNINSCD